MKNKITLLIILLAVQVALMFYVYSGKQDLGAYIADEPLLAFQPSGVDTVIINGPEKQQVLLKKIDGRWRLPEYYDAPVDGAALQSLMDKLAGLKKGLPVATTSEAAVRFKVAPEQFERHIVLKQGGKTVADLFVGTSPTFRKVHVRLSGSNDIVAVRFAAFDAGINAKDWLDHKMLALQADKINALSLGSLNLIRKGKSLVPATLGEGEQADERAIKKLVAQVADLRVASILGREKEASYGLDKPVLTCSITLHSGKKLQWVFAKPEKENHYILKTSDRDFFFTVDEQQVKPLLNAERKNFLQTDAVKEKATQPGAGGETAQ